MSMFRKVLIILAFFTVPLAADARQATLTPQMVNAKMQEIMKAHVTYKELTPELIKRILQNYIDDLDPNKTYFIESDIDQWIQPSDDLLKQVLTEYNQSNFEVFEKIQKTMVQAIYRRRTLEKQIENTALPEHVSQKEFKDLKWATNTQGLVERITKIKALQIETSEKLAEDLRDKALQRIAKRQTKYEEDILNPDPVRRENLILTNVLKASASALDAHTSYFTPDEAEQFMINVQQRLFGIGAQLRDDLNGFTITKIIEGGPAAMGKELKVKDRIIAVNGEPVVGMDITEAVGLIRGEENTPVTLTVIRDTTENDETKEQKLDIVVHRGEVVLKDTRYETSYEPFGDGVIGYLRLYTFYQDPESSSASDLTAAIQELKQDHNLKGLILDLRYNTGGLLSQAVEVAGLFITKGTIVSVKDHTGAIQHLRDLDGKMILGMAL